MARKRMVTRTIVTTKVIAVVYHIKSDRILEKIYTLSGELSENEALKAIELKENVKSLKIRSIEKEETLYGMCEDKFIELAEVMPPRTKSEQ